MVEMEKINVRQAETLWCCENEKMSVSKTQRREKKEGEKETPLEVPVLVLITVKKYSFYLHFFYFKTYLACGLLVSIW